MNKDFAPHAEALELKALKFDKPCFAYYSVDKQQLNLVNGYNSLMFSDYVHLANTIKNVPAPLYQQAFRWFREKYGIVSFVKKEYKDAVEIGFYFGIDTLKHFKFIDFYSKPYKTYEEAELECLKKLIEIVKQNDRDRRVE